MVAAYCSLDSNSSAKDVLSVHEDGFKVIVSTAIALRALINRALADVRADQTVLWSDFISKKRKKKKGAASAPNEDTSIRNTYKYPRVNGMSIEDLLPAPSKRKEVLEPMLLTLKDGEYRRKHRPIHSDGGTSTVGPEMENCQEDAIERNDAMAVYGF